MTTRVTGNSAPRDTRNEDAKREILKRIRDAQLLFDAYGVVADEAIEAGDKVSTH